MVNNLTDIWSKQKDFNKNFIKYTSNIDEKQAYTKDYILHLYSECDEVLREINWKMHRKHNDNISRQNLVEELIDVFKYWLSIALIWDVSPEEFLREFDRKSSVVEQRYKQERQLNLLKDKNIIGVDIDGVLADYTKGFVSFIEEETGTDLSNYQQKTYNLYNDLAGLAGSIDELKVLKHKYRSSGYKQTIPIISGATKGLKDLKEKGYTIVLLTSRPYKQYPRMFADTITWLKKNNFIYDAILWDEDKEERIIKEFPNMKFMVEDCYDFAKKIADKGYKVCLLDKPYNQGPKHKNIVRMKTWNELNNTNKYMKK